jgi:N-acetylglucosamine kinase-like BadF-type ATPase
MHVLAVDGGQSTIRIGLTGGGSRVEIEGVSRQEGDVVASVAEAVVRGWRDVGAPRVERAVLGLTTAPTDGPSQQALCTRVAKGIDAAEVWLADDAVTGHAGALSEGWGASVTVGTGVACLAMPQAGDPHIIGGHGYLLGDEGGAWWIGREAVRAVLRAADGRGPSTALSERAATHFGGLRDLSERLHGVERPVNTIARFAPLVLQTAEQGDEVAEVIASQATDELVTLVRAAVATIREPIGASVPVALGGRLMQDGPLRRRLDRAMREQLPAVAARSADGSPLDGALRLGAESSPGRYGSLIYVWGPPA